MTLVGILPFAFWSHHYGFSIYPSSYKQVYVIHFYCCTFHWKNIAAWICSLMITRCFLIGAMSAWMSILVRVSWVTQKMHAEKQDCWATQDRRISDAGDWSPKWSSNSHSTQRGPRTRLLHILISFCQTSEWLCARPGLCTLSPVLFSFCRWEN